MTTLHHISQLGPAFLSTPFRRYPLGPQAAYIHACCLAGKLMKAGIIDLYAPIVHGFGIAKYGDIDPFDNDFWLRAYRGQLERAAVLLVGKLPGYMDSDGIREEINCFELAGKPVFEVCPETLEVRAA